MQFKSIDQRGVKHLGQWLQAVAVAVAAAGRRLLVMLALIAGIFIAGAFGASSAWAMKPVMSAEELSRLIDRKAVVVLDVREILGQSNSLVSTAANSKTFPDFLPRSLSLPYSTIRGPANNPGRPVSAAKLSAQLSALGITPTTPLVIAHQGIDSSDFGAAARVYWTLKIAGFTQLAILDGGVDHWRNEDYPMVQDRLTLPATAIKITYDERQIVKKEEIAALLNQSQKKQFDKPLSTPLLLDARPIEYFTGQERHPAAARYGTLPGAAHFDQDDWFGEGSGMLKTLPQLQSLAKDRQLLTNTETISFCNAGHWSATNWFILSEVLGQKNNRMYPESMVAWSFTNLPMENEPSRLAVLWGDLKQAVFNLADAIFQD